MKRLLFIVNVDWFFLSHRLPIAVEARKQGYEVHVTTGITDRLDEFEKHGLIVHPLQMHRSDSSVISLISTFRQILRIYNRVVPDLVHLVTIKPVLLGGIASRLARVPSVVSAISGLGFVFVADEFVFSLRRKLVDWLYKTALSHKNQKVIFQNSDDRDLLVQMTGLASDKLVLIHGSGVDLNEYNISPVPSGLPVVLFAGRLIGDKGVGEFVEAAQRINSSKRQVRFILVGEIDPSNPTSLAEEELECWREGGMVEIWGQRSDMPQVLAEASIVVLPSYYGEGLPKILIEAAACGRAVITTDHPGCRDAIEPDVTGLLVPVRDTDALSRAMITLLDDPMRCRAMGRAGRKRAEKLFDVRQVVAKHLQIYKELIKKDSG